MTQLSKILVFVLVSGTVALVSINELQAADTTVISNSVYSSSHTGGVTSVGTGGEAGSAGQSGTSGAPGRDGESGASGTDGTQKTGEARSEAVIITIDQSGEITTSSLRAVGQETNTVAAVAASESTTTENTEKDFPNQNKLSAEASTTVSIFTSLRAVLMKYVAMVF